VGILPQQIRPRFWPELALALEQEINVATLILQFPVPTSPGEQVKK
jgi:hypothetical protein